MLVVIFDIMPGITSSIVLDICGSRFYYALLLLLNWQGDIILLLEW
jgi:hypothetical protein